MSARAASARGRLGLCVSLALLLLPACSKPDRSPEGVRRATFVAGDTVRVVFDMPGDDIGTPEGAATLERIRAEISAQGAGEVLGSGFGMGTMELVVTLRAEGSQRAVEEIIRAAYPAARYRIERRPQ